MITSGSPTAGEPGLDPNTLRKLSMHSREELIELVDMAQQTVDMAVRQLAYLRDATGRASAGPPLPDAAMDPLLTAVAQAALGYLERGDTEGARQVLGTVLPGIAPTVDDRRESDPAV
jgi:hypothetical protein